MSSHEYIIVKKITPAYWRATFNNGNLNLLSPESYVALKNLVAELEADKDVRVIVFDSSSPDYFIAHADLLRVGEEPEGPGTGLGATWPSLAVRIANLSAITVVAVRGRARGFGADFANTCDLRFASRERAVFCQPELGAGIIPGGGAFEWLPRLVGRARALEILISSDDYDATTAELYGWINRAVPDAEFEDFVEKLARRIAGFDAKLLVETKRVVNARWGMPNQVDFAAGMALFAESTKWPGAGPRIKALFEKGMQQDGETERNMGAVLGTITEEDLKKHSA
ncbi:enoyl- hydratase [Trichoderma arundinaceum]|uniref:Enoyl-hydratase n=1 Tax=Trichoderma arundinaceum TaxID=490622 RepID=A0A395NYX3_TRIAR|nr:enoyl- hydratase [Trichoderma arundinaceum]